MRPTQPGQSLLLLLDIVDALNAEKVPYAVIGAMAASVHGVVRASLDADAVLSLTAASLATLEPLFKRLDLATAFRKGGPDDPIAAVLVLSDAHHNKVDLLVGIKGFDPEAFNRAVNITFQSVNLRVIGLEDFIAMKIFAAGPQDLQDARRAMTSSSATLDNALLEQLTARYGKKYLKTLKGLQEETA